MKYALLMYASEEAASAIGCTARMTDVELETLEVRRGVEDAAWRATV